MAFPLHNALTPGTPVYGLLKMGALASVVGLKVGLTRRDKRRAAQEEPVVHAVAEPTVRRDPHPRSKKKKQRRRR